VRKNVLVQQVEAKRVWFCDRCVRVCDVNCRRAVHRERALVSGLRSGVRL
jgi:hypothetical protein